MSGFDTFYIVPSFAQPLVSCSVFMVGNMGDALEEAPLERSASLRGTRSHDFFHLIIVCKCVYMYVCSLRSL